MAWPSGKHFETLIAQAYHVLSEVRLIRHDVGLHRALIDLEGQWGVDYRVIASEVHRADGSVRYAYYILDTDNQLQYGFDNSPDIQAVKLHYGAEWKAHLHEEIPHQHDADGNLTLTPDPMTFEIFLNWLVNHLKLE